MLSFERPKKLSDQGEIMADKFHRAFGVYGIIESQNQLVVIKKNGGPYINRFDLPGGSLEDGESLEKAILREIQEETGLTASTIVQLGITSFKYPWDYKKWHYNQHICVFYEIKSTSGQLHDKVPQFRGQDSLGSLFVPLDQLTLDNSSPLVLKAKQYIQNNKRFNPNDTSMSEWKVLSKPIF